MEVIQPVKKRKDGKGKCGEREEGEDEKSFGMVMKVLERGNEEKRR